jgi:HAD superfamily hydrolase (TIGR01549 family)
MDDIKIISFDLEGTLTSLDFTIGVYYEGIPAIISDRDHIPLKKARAIVHKQYEMVGHKQSYFYDINYWSKVFNLKDYQRLLEKYAERVKCYADVEPALTILKEDYQFIISTNASREFLQYLLKGLEEFSFRVFSSISDYKMIKCPEFYGIICQEMGVQPDEIAHIGDNWEFDVISAQKVGIKTFYLNREQKSDSLTSLSSLTGLKARLDNI